jgi:c-di-GMP-binding flagellar brake protein YcgR
MFRQTYSLWRRLTGRSEPTPAVAEKDDRRLWLRYRTNLQTYYEPANSRAGEGRLSAQIRDISLAGVQLVVDRECKPGNLLTVELPTPEGETRSVLACVVHARKTAEREWTVGCSFSRELEEDDLASFQAARQPAAPDDSRHWERFECHVRASCQVVSAQEPSSWPATVLNISASGMAIKTDRDLPPGTLLSADLQDHDGKVITTILACVVHVLTRDGERVFGCNFIRELGERDLAALV